MISAIRDKLRIRRAELLEHTGTGLLEKEYWETIGKLKMLKELDQSLRDLEKQINASG